MFSSVNERQRNTASPLMQKGCDAKPSHRARLPGRQKHLLTTPNERIDASAKPRHCAHKQHALRGVILGALALWVIRARLILRVVDQCACRPERKPDQDAVPQRIAVALHLSDLRFVKCPRMPLTSTSVSPDGVNAVSLPRVSVPAASMT